MAVTSFAFYCSLAELRHDRLHLVLGHYVLGQSSFGTKNEIAQVELHLLLRIRNSAAPDGKG